MTIKYVIIGAGPAGLVLACKLRNQGEKSILLLESENEVGGLCRSKTIDEAPMDIGGGHFLDVRNPDVLQFLFQYMPETEWNRFKRVAKISLHDQLLDHPVESNLWQLPIEKQASYLESIAESGAVRGTPEPKTFVNWIQWKLGKEIAENYMLPYNEKVFGPHNGKLGTYWLNKLPTVSFQQTLRSCLVRQSLGSLSAHGEFYYPKKFGYGEVWKRMGEYLSPYTALGVSVQGIDFSKRAVVFDGNVVHAKYIINTAPWTSFRSLTGAPPRILKAVKQLLHTGIATTYSADTLTTPSHWIYYPDPTLPFHRRLLRHNFVAKSRGHWTETNLLRGNDKPSEINFINRYAYPLNSIGKPSAIKAVLQWAEKQGVIGLGRWGEHEHYNSDVTVARALSLAKKFQN